jgi:endonuclease/exonuclease/phosphatase family metal-dependent hydrolase
VTHEEISQRAYQLWRQRGCVVGSPGVDWFQAAHEIASLEALTLAQESRLAELRRRDRRTVLGPGRQAIKVATLNMLFAPESWGERRGLMVDDLLAEQPDCLLLQEVWEPAGSWLADRLSLPHKCFIPCQRPSGTPGLQDGIAVFSRHPFIRHEMLILSQGRVAQWVEIALEGQAWVVCNGHYYWHAGPHPERDRQVQRVLTWLEHLPQTMPIVVGGDFNGTPESSALALMRQHFTSAYAAYNGREPGFTSPTPLSCDWEKPWRGTLDYLFVNRYLRVLDCRLILNRPSHHNFRLYPSDHFGIAAELEILSDPEAPATSR